MAAKKKRTSARPAKKGTAKKRTAPSPNTKTRGRRRKVVTTKKAQDAAEAVAKVAKDNDAVGGRGLTAAKRRLRDTAIAARFAAGWTQQMIAIEFGITERQVRRVLDDHGKMPSGLDARPIELIEELLRGYRVDIADFEAMAHAFAEKHPAAAIGAKKGARDSRESYGQLLLALGKLPTNWELFRSEAQMVRIAEGMVETLEGLVRGDVAPEAALAHFRSLLPQGTPELTAG